MFKLKKPFKCNHLWRKVADDKTDIGLMNDVEYVNIAHIYCPK
jgi:hypothetical protein